MELLAWRVANLVLFATGANALGLTVAGSFNGYGPANCIKLSRTDAGSCKITTKCQGYDTSKTEFGFNCVSPDGETRWHSYGPGGFEDNEEFDSEVVCARCDRPAPRHVEVKPRPRHVEVRHVEVKPPPRHMEVHTEDVAPSDVRTPVESGMGTRPAAQKSQAPEPNQLPIFVPGPESESFRKVRDKPLFHPVPAILPRRVPSVSEPGARQHVLLSRNSAIPSSQEFGLPAAQSISTQLPCQQDVAETNLAMPARLALHSRKTWPFISQDSTRDDVERNRAGAKTLIQDKRVQLRKDVKELTGDMESISSSLQRLNAKVFASKSANLASAHEPAPAASALFMQQGKVGSANKATKDKDQGDHEWQGQEVDDVS